MLLQMAKFHIIMWLSNIPLYVCIYNTSSLSIHMLTNTGFFHILVIVDDAIRNTGMHASFQISVFIFFGHKPRSKTAKSHIFSVFLETVMLVFTVASIPMNTVGRFHFLNILDNTCYLWYFWWQPFWQVWGDMSLLFWFAFLWWLVMLSIFLCACLPSVCFWKNDYSDLLPI